ncbi:DUF6233 domain-containing protein [Streptomyces sp. AS02]|uniref:DUF6233 domain-containing protein n=1 Tax=Streptomyces sp. AS02 TaxID=2938946 RepID=UPI0020219F92|nr:DUF6233 domain-containing protein [Streptomyces sp. AS02]MCL8016953.1 DUF6233 domain-containing protein [Streptomyces sp. AS02]
MGEDDSGPRVLVVLPDGQVLNGILRGRRRDPDGRWWYQTTVDVPAESVQPVPGQDYDQVPTTVQDVHPWQLEAPPAEGERTGILHVGGCTAAVRRLTGVTDDEQARLFLREHWAVACQVCTPQP